MGLRNTSVSLYEKDIAENRQASQKTRPKLGSQAGE
jgi:hypothetical protein